jgi:hypothetical protein
MTNLFTEHSEEIIENFEIIFDSATNELSAKEKARSYYLSLVDDDIEVDLEEIISLAESYGFDFDDFESFAETE